MPNNDQAYLWSDGMYRTIPEPVAYDGKPISILKNKELHDEIMSHQSKLYTEAELQEEIENHDKKAFDMLSILGVPKERAISVANGIEVLSTRYRKEQAGYQYNLKHAVKKEREADIKVYNHMLTHIEESPFIIGHIQKKIIKETLGYAEIAIRGRE